MSEQLIISVSREYGSGGHEIAQKLAEYYKLPMYDHNLLDEVAASMNVSSKELAEFDEKRRNKFLYRSVMGMNSSPADNVARMQFDYIKKKADSDCPSTRSQNSVLRSQRTVAESLTTIVIVR